MKSLNCLFVFLALLIAYAGFSQNLNRNWFSSRYSSVKQIVFDQEKEVVFTLTGAIGESYKIEKKDLDGTLLWKYDTDSLEQSNPSHVGGSIKLLSGGKLAFLATEFLCDVASDGRFILFDSTGYVLFETKIELEPGELVYNLLEFPTDIWIIGNKNILKIAISDYGIVKNDNLDFFPIYGSESSWTDADGSYFIAVRDKYERKNQVEIFNKFGLNTWSYQVDGAVLEGYALSNREHLLLFSDKIQIINRFTGEVQSQFSNNPYSTFIDFVIFNDEILLIEYPHNTIYRLDDSLRLLEALTFGNNFHLIQTIENIGNTILIGGSELVIDPSHGTYKSPFLRELDFANPATFEFKKEAELINVEIDSLTSKVELKYSGAYWHPFFHWTLHNVKLIIKNNGDSNLERIRWNREISDKSHCGEIIVSEGLELNLLPDETKQFSIGNLSNEIFNVRDLPSEIEECFWLSSPDELLDADNNNDHLCKTFQVNSLVEIEYPLNDTNFEIFPNPTTDFFNLKGNFPIAGSKLLIYNALGTLVKTSELTDNKVTFNIPINDLATGIYFLIIEREKERKNIGRLVVGK